MDFTLLFIYFITVNKYRFCISVIGYINVQIIGIDYKNQYWSITTVEVQKSMKSIARVVHLTSVVQSEFY